MKIKKLLIALSVILGIGLTACADTTIKYNELPQNVQQFLGKHFAGQNVQKVTVDNDDATPDYDIYYVNGTKVEIESNGIWKEISNRNDAIPTTMLPDTIQAYVSQNYSNAKVVKAENDRKGYEVTLNNGVELQFNHQGIFMGIDH